MTKQERIYYSIGALLIFGSAFLFACKGILIKTAYSYGVDTISVLTLRMTFASPFYLFIVLRKRWKEETHPIIENSTWLKVILVGLIGYYLSAYINFLGLNYVTASLERILLFIYPTFVLLINVLIFRRKVTKLQWLALLITYSGILLAFMKHLQANQQKDIALGGFLVILSGFTYAFYLVGSDKLIAKVGTTRFTSWAMLASVPATIIHCFFANGLNIFHFPKEVYLISAFMAIASTVFPTFMLTEGIKRVGSSNASIMNSIGPIFTIVLATTFLNETLWLEQIVGTALVLVGVFLIGWKGRK
jgi:drug/metabolite transporter (DMT)-like permease